LGLDLELIVMVKRIIHGKEHLILREDGYGGFESIETETLTMKLGEVLSDEALTELADTVHIPLTALKAMPLIAFIKSDIADKDIMGWKQHQKVLKETGYDVGETENE